MRAGTTSDQWRAAALVLRQHALEFDKLAGAATCGVILPNAGPNGEPVACAYPADHLPSAHSWAFLPTVIRQTGGPR